MSDQETHTTFFVCKTCSSPDMNFEEMKSHLIDVHGIDTKKEVGTISLVSHLDLSEYYINVHEIVCGQVTLTRTTRSRRDNNDPMRI